LLQSIQLALAHNTEAFKELVKSKLLIILRGNVPVVVEEIDIKNKLILIRKIGTNLKVWTIPKAVKKVGK